MFRRIRDELVHTVAHGDGPTAIVGLAGVFGNVELWQQPFEILHRRHRTIAFDHFGTGETRVAPDRVSFDEQVSLVADVLDSFEVERCLLAGDSSFASVAVAVAHRWPERIDGLVLVGARMEHTADERTQRFVVGLREAFTPTLEGFVTVCLPEDDDGHLRRWLTDIIARTGAERAASLVESFYGIDVRPLLPSLQVPVLVIHGALDRINPLRIAHEVADQVQDAELVVLDDAGHVPTLSRPEAVATAIDDFAHRITAT